jgi:hypothetical protein
MIAGIHAMLIGFGLPFGGFGALVAPSEDETNELRRAYDVARQRSWLHGQLEAFRQAGQARSRGFTCSQSTGRKDRRVESSCIVVRRVGRSQLLSAIILEPFRDCSHGQT